jgi:RHS repeat-associated protein
VLAPTPDTFWHSDWLGSVRLASSAPNRTITFDRAFAPFGEMYNTVTGGTPNPDFAGMTRDAISDEGDTPNREYHQKQGRWISPDPAGLAAADLTNPQSWNRYAYVVNNPLTNIDPDGMDCIYIDPDTNEFHGWNPGDCDNSTEASANSGIYVDGSINSFQFNSSAGSLDYGYSDENGNVGAGTILGVAQPQFTPINDSGMIPGMLGPGDLILFSGVRMPTWVGETLGKLIGAIVGRGAEGAADKGIEIVAQDGTRITGYTQHGVDRAIGDGPAGTAGVRAGTKPQAILDALKNPKSIRSGIDSQGRPFKTFIGQDAKVVVNPSSGKIVSVNPLSGAGAR